MDAKLPPLPSIRTSSIIRAASFDSLIYDESYQAAAGNTGDHREGKCRGRRANADTSNEDHSFKTFTKDCNEWQNKHSVSLAPHLNATLERSALSGANFGFQGFSKLDAPFILKLGDTEQRRTHDRDNKGG